MFFAYVGFIGDHFFLLITDSTYSRIPGDKGGSIFFGLRIFFGKTCKTPHIQKLYFVILHKKLSILYCRTLFCILYSVTGAAVGIVSQRAHKDAHLFCFYFLFCHVLCFLFCFNAQAEYCILILAQKSKVLSFYRTFKRLFCFNALVRKLYFIVSHHISLVFYFQSH
jgi:hypothetical protein